VPPHPRYHAIIAYPEMSYREGMTLQKGMNFLPHKPYSIILMSVRKGAPYHDQWHAATGVLEYEGHDLPKSGRARSPDPKKTDQPLALPSGKLTENGRFFQAADEYKAGTKPARIVQVYEKIADGIWCDRGKHELIDAEVKAVPAGKGKTRQVCRFSLKPAAGVVLNPEEDRELALSRQIPTAVKVEVYKRDKGACVTCGKKENIHYDHNLPFSKGGTSLTAENVQLLCMNCNLKKSAKIMGIWPWLLGPGLVGAMVAGMVRGA